MLRLCGIFEVWARAEWSGWENRRGPSLWFSIPALLPIWSVMLINKWANKNSNHNSFTRHPICNPPGKPISGWPVRTIQFFFFFFLIKFHCPFPLPHTYLAVPGLCIWDLVLWPGIKLWPLALGAWNLSHWTTRDVPNSLIFHFHSWEFFYQVSTPLLTKSNPSDFRDYWIHALKIETQAPEIPNKSYLHLWRNFWWAGQATRVHESLQASHSSHLRWFPSHWSTHHWGLWT